MTRDFIAAAGGPVRFIAGGIVCAAWMAFCLAAPAFIAVAVGVVR